LADIFEGTLEYPGGNIGLKNAIFFFKNLIFFHGQLQLVGQLRFRIQKNIKRELVLKIIFLLKK